MKIFTIIVSIIFAIFSTAVMSYISMATPIGPWIAPTLALLGIIVFSIFGKIFTFDKEQKNNSKQIAFATFSGSIGAILATAIGFYFTAIYFLDKNLFEFWAKNPLNFSFLLAALSLTACVFGLWVADIFENKLVFKDKLSFPIGELVQKTISAKESIKKSIELGAGFILNTIFCALQSGVASFSGIIQKSLALTSKIDIFIFNKVIIEIPALKFDLWPMIWALGFVTGSVITVPLIIGVATKIFLAKPIYTLAFSDITWNEYIITFCSGLALSTAFVGILRMPKEFFTTIKNFFNKNLPIKNNNYSKSPELNTEIQESGPFYSKLLCKRFLIQTLFVLLLFSGFMTYFGFTVLTQIYTFIFAFICTYQISIISGKIGLATMGKFATFVTVPAIFLFSLDSLQIVLLTAFIGISGGVASDILFGRKMASISEIKSKDLRKYQYLGIVASSLFVGFIFWFLINHFGLGSEQLFALRAQNRWMLIDTIKNTHNFNYYIIFLGIIFGFILSKVKISPLLVMGGLFMPENITLGLIFGAIISMFFNKKENAYPFWSGVYAAGSIWMLIKSIF